MMGQQAILLVDKVDFGIFQMQMVKLLLELVRAAATVVDVGITSRFGHGDGPSWQGYCLADVAWRVMICRTTRAHWEIWSGLGRLEVGFR